MTLWWRLHGGKELLSACDTKSLIRLQTNPTGKNYASILSYYIHPSMFILHSDRFGEFQQNKVPVGISKFAMEWLQEQLRTLNTSIGHLNIQKWTTLSIPQIFCSILRRHLHHLAFLWIYWVPCRLFCMNWF